MLDDSLLEPTIDWHGESSHEEYDVVYDVVLMIVFVRTHFRRLGWGVG